MEWDEIIKIIKDLIDENIEDISPLSKIAERLGYSYFHISRKFHEIEGISFRKYVANRRIEQTAIELYTTKERIIDIAVRHGYSSQEAFTRAFVKIFGITPATYRRIPKPNSSSEKSNILELKNLTNINQIDGGKDMKLYVKQMYDWNCYAYYAEDVEEKYWDYFKSGLWWQMGNSFIKQFDNIADFKYCAENFVKYGESMIKQELKLIPAPWEKALGLFIPEINKLGVEWFIHGSVAMALWDINITPRDINIIIPNYSDFDKVRNHFYKLAIRPIERCDNWLMSGLGTIFMEASIGLAFHNKELEPYDMSQLEKVSYNGNDIYVSSLTMLKQDNEGYGRPERVALIKEKLYHT